MLLKLKSLQIGDHQSLKLAVLKLVVYSLSSHEILKHLSSLANVLFEMELHAVYNKLKFEVLRVRKAKHLFLLYLLTNYLQYCSYAVQIFNKRLELVHRF